MRLRSEMKAIHGNSCQVADVPTPPASDERLYSPIHPLGCVIIHCCLYIIGTTAYLRPNYAFVVPRDPDQLAVLFISAVIAAITIGTALALWCVYIVHSNLKFTGDKMPPVCWALLAVFCMTVLQHGLVAAEQTAVVWLVPGKANLSYIPSLYVLRFCAHAMGLNTIAIKCGASSRDRWIVQICNWVIYASSLLSLSRSYFSPSTTLPALLFHLGLAVESFVVFRIRRKALQAMGQVDRPKRLTALYMIPIGVVKGWMFAIVRLLKYFELVGAGIPALIGGAMDLWYPVTLCMILADVMWQAEQESYDQMQEEKVRRAAAELQYDAQNKFLRYLFHELRVPLNGIVLASEELADATPPDAEQQENIKIIGMGAMSMSKLLDDCLSLAKIESGKLVLEMSTFSPRELLTSVTASFPFRFKSQECVACVADDVPDEMVGDAGRLRQVLSNFTSNAIKFTPEGGRIIFRVFVCGARDDVNAIVSSMEDFVTSDKANGVVYGCRNLAMVPATDQANGVVYACSSPVINTPARSGKELIVFVVEDSGIGISKEDRNRLFCPFEQIRAGASQKGNGTGLGLSICKNIITRLQGSIGCATVEHRGSKFWFAVPINPRADSTTLTRLPLGSPTPQLQLQQEKAGEEENEGDSTTEGGSDVSVSPDRATAACICEARERVMGSVLQDNTPTPASTVSDRPLYHSANSGESTAETTPSTARDLEEEMERTRAHSKASTAGFSPQQRMSPHDTHDRPTSTSPHAMSVRSACCDGSPDRTHAAIENVSSEAAGGGKRESSVSTGQYPAELAVQSSATLSKKKEASSQALERSKQGTTSSTINTSQMMQQQQPQQQRQAESHSRSQSQTQVAQSHAPGSGLPLPHQVVVVDDTDSNRLLLSRLCQKLGASIVLSASNGHEALELPHHMESDVWFVDRNMPGMDGMQLCAALRAQGCVAPIIGVTGDALDEDQAAFIAAGATMVLPKPCTRTTVSQALHKVGYGAL